MFHDSGNIGEVASRQCRTGFLGCFCWVTGLFCANFKIFQVAEVALMYVSHRASLVSAKTLVLLFCFPTETLTESLFLLDLAIYFCETCKNQALGHIGSCQSQFDSTVIKRNTCTQALLPKPWYCRALLAN